jgi:hypothetical protein
MTARIKPPRKRRAPRGLHSARRSSVNRMSTTTIHQPHCIPKQSELSREPARSSHVIAPVANPDSTDSEIDDDIAEMAKIVFEIIHGYYEALVPAVRACLAVVASLALEGRTLPLCLMLEGFSGYGKTAVLQMFLSKALLASVIYRSDKFTPKSFVTHAASVKRKDLSAIDLLPKLDEKTLVTKELAPLFRGREDDLMDTFSHLCTVLDGKGLTTDSGTQGQRGYRRSIIFKWLGATTPVPPETHRLMYQLGTRLLFYEMDAVAPTAQDLFSYLKRDVSKEAEDTSRDAIERLLVEFFDRYPVSSVQADSIEIDDKLLLEIARWADLLALGRAELKTERSQDGFAGSSSKAIAANPPEAGYKIGNYFKQLARGSALIHGRNRVDSSDLEIVAHVAISSIPGYFRPIIRQLRKQRVITSTDAAALCKISPPTARKYLYELSLLGFGTLEKGSKATDKTPERADTLTRASKFDWMRLATTQ